MLDLRTYVSTLILLVGFAGGAEANLDLFNENPCTMMRYKDRFAQMKKRIDQQVTDPEYPFKAKLYFGTLNDAAPKFYVNDQTRMKVAFQNYKPVVTAAFVNIKDGKVAVKHVDQPEKRFKDPVPEDVEYYRRANLEYLREQYREWGFPPSVSRSLELQEGMLAKHRTYEFQVTMGGELAMFLRVQFGAHFQLIRGETAPFAGDVPYQEMYMSDGPFFYRKRVPTWMLPMDMMMRDPYADTNPLNKVRSQFENYGIVEIGRAFVNKNLSPTDRHKAQQIGWGMLRDMLPDFAPGRDLRRLVIVATSGKTATRLYPRELGLTLQGEITPLIDSHMEGRMYDVLGRQFDNRIFDPGNVPENRISNPPPVREGGNKSGEVYWYLASGEQFAKTITETKDLIPINLDFFMQSTHELKTDNLIETKPFGREGWQYR